MSHSLAEGLSDGHPARHREGCHTQRFYQSWALTLSSSRRSPCLFAFFFQRAAPALVGFTVTLDGPCIQSSLARLTPPFHFFSLVSPIQ